MAKINLGQLALTAQLGFDVLGARTAKRTIGMQSELAKYNLTSAATQALTVAEGEKGDVIEEAKQKKSFNVWAAGEKTGEISDDALAVSQENLTRDMNITLGNITSKIKAIKSQEEMSANIVDLNKANAIYDQNLSLTASILDFAKGWYDAK